MFNRRVNIKRLGILNARPIPSSPVWRCSRAAAKFRTVFVSICAPACSRITKRPFLRSTNDALPYTIQGALQPYQSGWTERSSLPNVTEADKLDLKLMSSDLASGLEMRTSILSASATFGTSTPAFGVGYFYASRPELKPFRGCLGHINRTHNHLGSCSLRFCRFGFAHMAFGGTTNRGAAAMGGVCKSKVPTEANETRRAAAPCESGRRAMSTLHVRVSIHNEYIAPPLPPSPPHPASGYCTSSTNCLPACRVHVTLRMGWWSG